MARGAVHATLLLLAALVRPAPAPAQTAGGADATAAALRALPLGGLHLQADAVGLSRSGHRLWAVEPVGPIVQARPRVVLVGGLDGRARSRESMLRLLDWWFSAPESERLRHHWQIAAVPCASPEPCTGGDEAPTRGLPLVFPPSGVFFDGQQDPTAQHLWRWTTMQAPTLVVEIREGWPRAWEANDLARALVSDYEPATPGSLAAALGSGASGHAWSAPVPAVRLTARASVMPAAFAELLDRSVGVVSPQRVALLGRMARPPLDVARMLALRYPAEPSMSYIPALAWSGALRVAAMTGEERYRRKPLADMAPFLTEQRSSIEPPYLLTSLAGHLAFADLAALDGDDKAEALARKAADFMLEQGSMGRDQGAPVRFGRGWTDDMFMATSVLARVAAQATDEKYAAAAGWLLTSYAATLQRKDGLFVHAKEAPHAWGRGNGFAAFGLMEALSYLPVSWPDRARVLESFRAVMTALARHQAPDGLWRQVVDEPGSYREVTVSAMAVTAMARGIRQGWLDGLRYRPVVDRAWSGLVARVGADGTLLDVCAGTGAGATLEYYLTRPALDGPDDRGGAMVLTAAIEMHRLTTR